MGLFNQPAHELQKLLQSKEISCRELTEAVLTRVDDVEPRVQSYITRLDHEARQQAEEIDRRIAQGEPVTPFMGIPVALKDNLCTEGVETTCASGILRGFRPPYDATVVTRLKEAGAVFVGKTNLDEFAMGSSTENSGFFTTRNPWDLSRVPGGSSGGSTAAVGAGEAIAALGSDTGGSIRQPASFCGVVGMKPTYGRVSRYGLVAFASSLDQIGPITQDVTDCALLLRILAGNDPMDSTSLDHPVPDYGEFLRPEVGGLRIGVPTEYFGEGVQEEISHAVRTALGVLEGMGATVEECSTPHAEHALPVYYIIAPAEASSNLARYDGVQYGHRTAEDTDIVGLYQKTRKEGFGHEVKHRIMLGTYALSSGYYDAYYLKASKVRTLIKQDFDKAFEKYDVLVTPTSPTVAFSIGEKSDDPLQMKLSDVLTIPANMAGLPGISLPTGFHEGLPIGLQIIGRPLDEGTVLQVAYAYEQATEWHRRKADLRL
ncbi:MAG: Asp-tRNA(Asn)/Glu-tRNA(Gln) amidotransferase subunit GatA [Armatimonadetes bacterium]|nr:Asp-tRNA(Asn)/Glu-tRNA(Gln) amidotransferase subunit GatA [Armatimonadota bacterium]